MDDLHDRQRRLQENLRELGSVLVAYSGGVDSAYLAWVARRVLGKKMRAVIADSPSLARWHFAHALYFAHQHGIPLEVIRTEEMENEAYVRNDAQRCFHCKNELFAKMAQAQLRLGFAHLAYGMNLDDRADFRPGQKAALEHGVRAPLAEAGLTKADVRRLSHEDGLPVWDRPASACLSSRVAYGQPVTREKLGRIEQAEDYLRGLGLRRFRVRDHGGLARLEIAADEMPQVLAVSALQAISAELRRLGFDYVALDCEGFQSGSMNRALASSSNPIPSHAAGLS